MSLMSELLASEAARAFPDLLWFPAVVHGNIPCAVTKVGNILCSFSTSGVSSSKLITEVPSDLKEHIACL